MLPMEVRLAIVTLVHTHMFVLIRTGQRISPLSTNPYDPLNTSDRQIPV